jgi:MFS family permease
MHADRRSLVSAHDAWPSYAALAAIGYVIYGVGAIVPYLRTQLGLSDAEVGLHSTAIALGVLATGVVTPALARRFGEIVARGAALAGLAIAVGALAIAPTLAVTLVAGGLVGFGTGTMLGYANAILVRPGGRRARLRVARANLWAMVAAFIGPLAVATAVTNALPWGLGLAPAFGLLVLVAVDLRAGARVAATAEVGDVRGRLPSGYWLSWAFLVAAVAIEFSIVFWGATLIQRRTGVETATATALGGLFLGGMFVGRLVLSLGLGTGGDIRRPAAIGVVLAIAGASIAWTSTASALSAGGLFVAGLGVAGLYPLGVAAALATTPDQPALAATRLTLASGLAVLVAPLALGAVADVLGVVAGWGLVVAFALAALALAATLPGGVSGEA